MEKEITIKASDFLIGKRESPDNTMYGIVSQILQLDRNSEDFEKRLKGIIKRFWHYEKKHMYQRFDGWLKNFGADYCRACILPVKINTHSEWAKKSDEEIWTS